MLRFTENNEVIRDDAYRAILVGLQTSEDISYSMEELKGLAEAANVEVLGQMIQNLERPNTATLIGKGKVEELAEMVKNMEADTVIFNDELTGMQLRNLEDAVGVRDRPDDFDSGYLRGAGKLAGGQTAGRTGTSFSTVCHV